MEQISESRITTPQKKLFLIDGVGAVLSALLLGGVLVRFVDLFGIPKPTLYLLASLPIIFAFYDFYCYFKVNKKLGIALRGIATLNFCYCALSAGLAIYHSEQITQLGWIYLVTEILIVCSLAFLQLLVAKK